MLSDKLENIISGHGVNDDDACWLRVVLSENERLQSRISELEVLYRSKDRCECGDDEACAHVRRAEKAEAERDAIETAMKDDLSRIKTACRERMSGDITETEMLKVVYGLAMKHAHGHYPAAKEEK